MKLKIENFQSIKKAELEIKGLTVITGPNNTGKSACARALAGVFTNIKGSSHVRIGEKYSEVEVDFEDGSPVVVWKKGSKVNDYIVDGKVIGKVGTDVPEEVMEGLGVRAVEVDGREIYPQIAKQFEQIFLLDLPPSSLSSALSDVDRILQLEVAMSNARSDLRDEDNRIKYAKELLNKESKLIQGYEGLEDIQPLLTVIDALEAKVAEVDKMIIDLKLLKSQKEELLSQVGVLSEVELVDKLLGKIKMGEVTDIRISKGFLEELNGLKSNRSLNQSMLLEEKAVEAVVSYLSKPSQSELNDNRISMDYLHEVGSLRKSREETKKVVSNLSNLNTAVPSTSIEVKEAGAVFKTFFEVNKLMAEREALTKFIAIEGALKRLAGGNVPENLVQVEKDDKLIDELISLKRARNKLYLFGCIVQAGFDNEIFDVVDSGRIDKGLQLAERLDELNRLSEMRSKWAVEQESARTELSEVEAELSRLKEELGECPLCGQAKGSDKHGH